jgi:ubiquinone/menaquinone biosynthesis C-methylase UbiE
VGEIWKKKMKKLYKLFPHFYQKAQEIQAKEIFSFFKENKKILDLGCGSGSLAKILISKYNFSVFGLDIKDNRIFEIPFQVFNGKEIPFPDDYFDGVLISFVLHHAENPISLLKEAKRVGKFLILFEDTPENLFQKFFCWIHFLTWNWFFGKTQKFFFLSSKEWKKIFEDLNLKLIVEKEISFNYNFLYPVKRKMFILSKC